MLKKIKCIFTEGRSITSLLRFIFLNVYISCFYLRIELPSYMTGQRLYLFFTQLEYIFFFFSQEISITVPKTTIEQTFVAVLPRLKVYSTVFFGYHDRCIYEGTAVTLL